MLDRFVPVIKNQRQCWGHGPHRSGKELYRLLKRVMFNVPFTAKSGIRNRNESLN